MGARPDAPETKSASIDSRMVPTKRNQLWGSVAHVDRGALLEPLGHPAQPTHATWFRLRETISISTFLRASRQARRARASRDQSSAPRGPAAAIAGSTTSA